MDKEPMDQNQRALDRFLNDLTTSQASAGGHDVDPALVKAMRELRSLAQTPPPDPMRERVTSEVEIAIERLTGEGRASTRPLNGATPRATVHTASRLPRTASGPANSTAETIVFPWRLALVAAALLVLLGAGYVLFGSGLLDDDPRNTVPAAVAPDATPATPAPAAMPGEAPADDQDVAIIDLPAGALPQGLVGATLQRWTMPPDSRISIEDAQDVLLRYVISGRVSVRSADPLRVLREAGDGQWADVAAGVEVALGPGDTLVQLRATETEFVNTDQVPVEFVAWNLAAGQSSLGSPPQGWSRHDFSGTSGAALDQPDAPARARLRRVVLAPGEELVPPAGVLLRQTVSESGSVLAGLAGGGLRNIGRQPATIYELVLAPLDESRDDQGVGSPPPVVHAEDNDQSAAPEENGDIASPFPSHPANRIGH
jgi:hypothetical protein